MSVKSNIESFAKAMEDQLNLINEGKNLHQFNENFKEFPSVCFPTPYLEYSNEELVFEDMNLRSVIKF